MKITVVVTSKNDEEGVKKLQEALENQTRSPNEIVIIRAEEYRNCSRAEGRNIGIGRAKHQLIAVTDVGCTPHRDWLEQLENAFHSVSRSESTLVKNGVVIAGFYHTVCHTALQRAIAPYLAVLPDQRNSEYLPASRSIAFTRRAWELVGGYPERAKSGAEDLLFAYRLRHHPGIRTVQAPNALVDWEPPQSLAEFFNDTVKHTKGNLEARYWPHIARNFSVLFRWVVFLLVPWFFPLYLVWPIVKNSQRIADSKGQSFLGWQEILWLPIVQLVADAAVINVLVGGTALRK